MEVNNNNPLDVIQEFFLWEKVAYRSLDLSYFWFNGRLANYLAMVHPFHPSFVTGTDF